MQYKVMGRTQNSFTGAYAQRLSANCDLNLKPSDMVLARYTSYHDYYVCQIIFKSHDAGRCYESGMILEQRERERERETL